MPWELWSARGGDSSPVLLSSIIEENTPESEDGAGSCYLVTSGLLARHLTIWPSHLGTLQSPLKIRGTMYHALQKPLVFYANTPA